MEPPPDELPPVLSGQAPMDAQVVLQVAKKGLQPVGRFRHLGIVQVVEKVGHGTQYERGTLVQLLVGVPLLPGLLVQALLVNIFSVPLQPIVEVPLPCQPVIVRPYLRKLVDNLLQLNGNQRLRILS